MVEILFALVLICSICILYRNELVHSYLINLNHRCAEACHTYLFSNTYTEAGFIEKREMYESIMRRLNYDKLLFSFKKLKDENLLTKEELAFLNNESLH